MRGISFLFVGSVIVLLLGCHHTGSLNGDAGPDTDTDTDTDSDTDTDTDPIECNLGEYSGSLSIETQSDVATLAGYTSISGDLDIECHSCTDLSDLFCLATVDRCFLIADNTALTNLDGLSGLTSVGEAFLISDNDILTDLGGLSALTSVGESLSISLNDVLANLDGLGALTSVGGYLGYGYLGIAGNNALTNLDGLSALTSVFDDVIIFENIVLPDCEACDLLDQLTSGPNSIDVYDNLDDSCTPVPDNCP